MRTELNDNYYYVWIGGSCDYNHKDRPGGGAYILQKGNYTIETYTENDINTTEFRMLLKVMLHAMDTLPSQSTVIFNTNVSYLQNFDKEPTDKSTNKDLIEQCICSKSRHQSVSLKMMSYYKYEDLQRAHNLANDAMKEARHKIK